ncbi:2TM domain-containing protein [Nocardioides sp. GY 10113]|uniref:2TM domain-containing protein n=1 Tax=Nocardioides sp. GY 10113 TaxID=2569761 RepID=UPI0010A90D54|nr:2TM domain-containing protein [Nocardioides sp. GY 10113]TIC87550.1 2TM domain-containing protein [Nocardioides sp. GY 10113]
MSARDDEVVAAEKRARALTDLLWHVGAFLILNAFFWILDLVVGQSGLQWAFWLTLFWGLGLAFHVLSFLIEGRQVARRAALRYERDDREERDRLYARYEREQSEEPR